MLVENLLAAARWQSEWRLHVVDAWCETIVLCCSMLIGWLFGGRLVDVQWLVGGCPAAAWWL
eukprot:2405245-Lingulodinium_polyedra.AAC.1